MKPKSAGILCRSRLGSFDHRQCHLCFPSYERVGLGSQRSRNGLQHRELLTPTLWLRRSYEHHSCAGSCLQRNTPAPPEACSYSADTCKGAACHVLWTSARTQPRAPEVKALSWLILVLPGIPDLAINDTRADHLLETFTPEMVPNP